ncbi:MAG: DUF6077 domain-containing protein [Candidatus Limnocylindria bacterium]
MFAVAAAIALGSWAWLARRGRPPPAAAGPAPAPARAARPAWLRGLRLAGLALGVAGALRFGGPGDAVALWHWTVATLGAAALALLLLEVPHEEAPARGPRLELALLALALSAAAYALVAHRPDADDAFYVNLAVAAVDAPAEPLLAADTLHGVAGLPLHLPIYRVHSFELANAALSFLSGAPTIQVFHFGAAALAAFLVPIAHARLFRLLTPKHWLAAVATLVVVLAAAGETHRWYGNFGFVRIWQGKSLQLFVFTPLVYAYAMQFALRPGLARWGLLAAAQIAALGSSSAALWAAPAAGAIGLCSALPPSRRGLKLFAVGLLASGYVLGAGWIAKGWMDADAASQQPAVSQQEVRDKELADLALDRPGVRLEQALGLVLGDSRLRRIALAGVLIAWAASSGALARRFALAAPLAVALVLLHPAASSWVVANVTGESYWRALWALPVPILMALSLVAPLEVAAAGRRRSPPRAAWALLLGAFALLAPGIRGPSSANGVRLAWPSLKVEPTAHAWAAELSASVPPGSVVAAPGDVGVWLPTFHQRVHPLLVRDLYLAPYRAQLGDPSIQLRVWMTAIAGGERTGPDAGRLFRGGLERFQVRGVCLRVTPGVEATREALRAAGFRRSREDDEHEIWVRS